MDAALRAELIAFCGIETDFNDAWGQPVTVAEQDQLHLLQALGFDVADDAVAREQLLERQLDFWQQLLQPVSVQPANEQQYLMLQVDLPLATEPLHLTLRTEDGRTESFNLTPVDGELVQVVQLDGTEYHQYQHELPFTLNAGYHQVELQQDGISCTQSLIITPGHCYRPAAFSEKKQWGIALQLYGLRSAKNWGIGDFTDLAQTLRYLAAVGADFVGLNPIHALYPAMPENASPYSPSSRRWLNISYIDVTAMPGFDQCQRTAALVHSPDFNRQLAVQRSNDYVDYSGVMQLKLPVLKTLFHWFSEHQSQLPELVTAFDQFKLQGGDSLRQLALYDALHMHLIAQDPAAWGWPNWPEQYRDAHSEAVQQFAAANQDDIEFFSYLQFCAQQQLWP